MQGHMMAFKKNNNYVMHIDENGVSLEDVEKVYIGGTWSGTFPIPGYDVEVVSGIIKDITPA